MTEVSLRIITFSHYLAQSYPIFSLLKILKLHMLNSQILKLIYFFSNDSLQKQLDHFFPGKLSF